MKESTKNKIIFAAAFIAILNIAAKIFPFLAGGVTWIEAFIVILLIPLYSFYRFLKFVETGFWNEKEKQDYLNERLPARKMQIIDRRLGYERDYSDYVPKPDDGHISHRVVGGGNSYIRPDIEQDELDDQHYSELTNHNDNDDY